MRKITLILMSLLLLCTSTVKAAIKTDGTYYRLKEKTSGLYMNIWSHTKSDGTPNSYGGFNIAQLNESSEDQMFQFEQSGNGFKIKSKSGRYMNLYSWNVCAEYTTDTYASVVYAIEKAPNEYQLNRISATYPYGKNYFKVGVADGGNSSTKYIYCDAPEDLVATWVFEEVEEDTDEPESETITAGLYRIKNKCKDLSKQSNSVGNGAYMSSTYSYTFSESSGYKAPRDINCSSLSMSDLGCIWSLESAPNGNWRIKNVHTNKYVGDTKNSGGYVSLTDDKDGAAIIKIVQSGEYCKFILVSLSTTTDYYLYPAGQGVQMTTNNTLEEINWGLEPAEKINVTLNPYGNSSDESNVGNYASLCLPFAVNVPIIQGVIACGVKVDGSTAILNFSNTGDVPANTGVILKSSGTTVSVDLQIIQDREISSFGADNDLIGTNVEISLTDDVKSQYYVLGVDNKSKKIGLRNPGENVSKIPANRAYLYVEKSGANAFQFVVGEMTAIETVAVEKADTPIYDLSGRRVLNTAKGGIYIQNGKKFIVK